MFDTSNIGIALATSYEAGMDEQRVECSQTRPPCVTPVTYAVYVTISVQGYTLHAGIQL